MDGEQKKDDELIDFSALGKKVTAFFKHSSHSGSSSHSDSSPAEEQIDLRKIFSWIKINGRWLLPLFLILLAFGTSVYLRTMPLHLPITEEWAGSTVTNFYRNQLQQQAQQQFPNLPEQNRQALLQKEWEKFSQENQQLLQNQIRELSLQYKNQFRDDNGTPYLLGIDPYHYYRQTFNVLTYGHPGTAIKEGKLWDYHRLAPLGDEAEWNFHHWFAAYWHRFLNLFGDFPLMLTFFLVGTLFSALTVIPGFFIGRKITGNSVGGFFTAMLLAVISFFVARTTGESSDTDVYAVFFPVLITWLFLEALDASTLRRRIVWASFAGFSTGVFAFAWTGWWYIATFLVITQGLYLLLLLGKGVLKEKLSLSQVTKSKPFLAETSLFGAYVLSSALFVSLFTPLKQVLRILLGPLQFLRLKDVAVSNIWPNIRTTVAELNVPSFSHVIEQFDGTFFFVLAAVGILFLIFRPRSEHSERSEKEKNEKSPRDYWDLRIPFLFAMWFIAASFATTKGIRFVLQLTPVFSFGLGGLLGIIWHYSSRWISKEIKLNPLAAKILVFLILALLLIPHVKSGYSQAYHSLPSVSDGWYNVLTKIKNEAPQNAVITSWWDFGHWFKAIADRAVTFDGGNQVNWGAYWVGRSLLTSQEERTVGIVRMLNCGQNSAFKELDKIWQDPIREIDVLNELVTLDKARAMSLLSKDGLSPEQIAAVLQYTHCEAPPDYYIASEDMVGKAGVWGHFGSWDFRRAVMHLKTKKLPRSEAVEYLNQTFGLHLTDADTIHNQIQNTDADKWISSWPGYLSGFQSCQRVSASELRCLGGVSGSNFALRVTIGSWDAVFEGSPGVTPNSLVYADREGIHEKTFTEQTAGFSVVLIPEGESYKFMVTDPLQTGSMFTKLFFFEGHGLHCFSKFEETQAMGGGKILVWQVDYSCKQQNQVFFQLKEEISAAHLLISTSSMSEEEALALIQDLQKNITTENFGLFAEKYSDDEGSKQNGGDLGWFGKGVMVQPFEEVAFSLSPGQISEPVKTQFGYHLIFLKGKRDS